MVRQNIRERSIWWRELAQLMVDRRQKEQKEPALAGFLLLSLSFIQASSRLGGAAYIQGGSYPSVTVPYVNNLWKCPQEPPTSVLY
jgi:hypothetical protein